MNVIMDDHSISAMVNNLESLGNLKLFIPLESSGMQQQ